MLIPAITFLLAIASITSLGSAMPASTRDRYPHRTVANVSVIDTPLVRASLTYAREHSDDVVYAHLMRCWLLGTLMISHNATLSSTIDPEAFAVATLLHDLGLDRSPNNTDIVSPDRRFEVDGAIAARNFIKSHTHGRKWDARRVQLVWDAIALHGEARFALFKEPEVAAVSTAVSLDFDEPRLGVTQEEFDTVVTAFPKVGRREHVIETFTWLCSTKPNSTYDNYVQGYGERLVPGYSPVGHRVVDAILGPT
jgi:hypothetical protein